MQIINFDSAASWEQKVTLDNNIYTIACVYNTRDDAWYINVYDVNDVAVVLGKKFTLNMNVFNNVHTENRPLGALVMIATTADKTITRDTVGSEVQLFYITKQELDELFS